MAGTNLDGRVAVVIGGGSGVGRGIALGLGSAGAAVVVADIDGASAEAVAQEVRAAGATAWSAAVDGTDLHALEDLASRVERELGAVHVVVTTVGVILDRPLGEATEADWSWFLEFNLLSATRVVAAFLPRLRTASGLRHVVITSSMAGLLALGPEMVGGVRNGLYTTTKHALVGYTDMLRQELAPEGIGVSVLVPGLVAGNLSATSARNRPERYGGPLPEPQRGTMPHAAMDNADVGPIVVRAIAADRFYIFTHPDSVALVEQRHRALLADADFARGAPST
jgi:NAD(P)-dependent dehydrogenase (short-subunit alcohol dehydrogenase family)